MPCFVATSFKISWARALVQLPDTVYLRFSERWSGRSRLRLSTRHTLSIGVAVNERVSPPNWVTFSCTDCGNSGKDAFAAACGSGVRTASVAKSFVCRWGAERGGDLVAP